MSEAHGVVPHGPPPGAGDELTLIVGGVRLGGWQRISITRSMDQVPANFNITVTEKYPNTTEVSVKPGQVCAVQIGADLALTGYVDRYGASIGPGDHTITIEGRSKSEDLVDCAAFVGDVMAPGMQIMAGSALSIAQKLAAPYGVTITSLAGEGAQIPQFNVNLGETAWEIIDRVTRFSKLICYDMPDGSMVMAQAGSEQMSSGFALGTNIEQASVTYSMDGRYSVYEGHFLSTMVFGSDAGVNSPGVGTPIYDTGVPRFRKRYVISEQTQLGQSLANDRALWERNRRYGRSLQFNVTCDAWRDASGNLWAPNHVCPIRADVLKIGNQRDVEQVHQATWLIASVTYIRDENGQHGQLIMMPIEAFSPEPVVLQPIPPLVGDVEANNPTRPGPSTPGP